MSFSIRKRTLFVGAALWVSLVSLNARQDDVPGATVEVIGYISGPSNIYWGNRGEGGSGAGFEADHAAARDDFGNGGGGGEPAPEPLPDVYRIQKYWGERRGGNYILPATTGCGPVTLSWSKQASRATTISGSVGASFYGSIQMSYGVTDTVTVGNSGTYELAKNDCGYIVGKEGLHYGEFDIYKNEERIGSGAILFLQDIQIIKNLGMFNP